MKARTAIAAAVFFSASTVAASSHGEVARATGQTAPDVPPEAYALRRALLAEQVDGPIIVPGANLIRGGSRKQDLDFWYLTGVRSPYAILVIAPDSSGSGGRDLREVLFLPERFQLPELNIRSTTRVFATPCGIGRCSASTPVRWRKTPPVSTRSIR